MCGVCRDVTSTIPDSRSVQVLDGEKVSHDGPLCKPNCSLIVQSSFGWAKPHFDGWAQNRLNKAASGAGWAFFQVLSKGSWKNGSTVEVMLSTMVRPGSRVLGCSSEVHWHLHSLEQANLLVVLTVSVDQLIHFLSVWRFFAVLDQTNDSESQRFHRWVHWGLEMGENQVGCWCQWFLCSRRCSSASPVTASHRWWSTDGRRLSLWAGCAPGGECLDWWC